MSSTFDFQSLRIANPIVSVHPRAMIAEIAGLQNRLVIELESNAGISVKLLRQGARAIIDSTATLKLAAEMVEDVLLQLPGPGSEFDRQEWAGARVLIKRLWRNGAGSSLEEASEGMLNLMKVITAPQQIECARGTFEDLSLALQALADLSQRHVRLSIDRTAEQARISSNWPDPFADMGEVLLRTSKPTGDKPDFAGLPNFRRQPSTFSWQKTMDMDSGHDRLAAGGALHRYFHLGPGDETGRAFLKQFLSRIGLA